MLRVGGESCMIVIQLSRHSKVQYCVLQTMYISLFESSAYITVDGCALVTYPFDKNGRREAYHRPESCRVGQYKLFSSE